MKVAFILSGLPDGLQCLERNREKVATILKQYGWNTRVETTFHSQASLLTIINEYKDQKIDDFIFFYTGHGDASSDEGILTLKLHDGTTIDINTLHREYLSKLNIERKAIILDACYSGNFVGRRFHDYTEYLCSSDFDEESYEDATEGGLNYSYFSYYFCEAIDTLTGKITLDMINDEYLKPKIGVQKSKYISIDSKMVIADKTLDGIKEELKNSYQFLINYFSPYNKNDFLKVSESFLDKNLYARIKEYRTIEEIIVHISENERFPCIIKELFNDDNAELGQWLSEQELSQCQREQEEVVYALLVVVFKFIEKSKYEVTFIAKDLPHMIDESDSFIYDFNIDKEKFMKKVMSYILVDVGTCNPKVDLVLPLQLMTEAINLWEAGFMESLSRLARTNIRYYARYNTNADMKEKILIPQWNEIKEKIQNGNSLKCIDSEGNIGEIGSNMEYCGISSRFILENKHIKALINTGMGYIMLWITNESSNNLQELYENINRLQEKYYECNTDPINLMWDDPNTYYYPDQKGE
jgi:hypothetical protein